MLNVDREFHAKMCRRENEKTFTKTRTVMQFLINVRGDGKKRCATNQYFFLANTLCTCDICQMHLSCAYTALILSITRSMLQNV